MGIKQNTNNVFVGGYVVLMLKNYSTFLVKKAKKKIKIDKRMSHDILHVRVLKEIY